MTTKRDQPKGDAAHRTVRHGDDEGRHQPLIDKPGFREGHPVEQERAERERQSEADEARHRQEQPAVVTTTTVNPVSTELRDGANQPAAPQQAVTKDPEAEREPNQDAPPPRHHQPGRDHELGRKVQ